MRLTKKEMIKIITATMLFLSALVLSIGIGTFTAEWINRIVTILTALSAYCMWLLNHSNTVYILWNKLKLKMLGDTVSWTGTNRFNIEKGCNFKELVQKYVTNYNNKNSETGMEISPSNSDRNLEIKIRGSKNNREISFILTNGSAYDQIKISYSTSMAYKDSINEFSVFLNFVNEFQKITDYSNDEDIFLNDEFYSVDLTFIKFNPFYHLSIRKLDEENINEFELKFNDRHNNSSIKIKPRTLTIISSNKESIDESLKKYVVLSSID